MKFNSNQINGVLEKWKFHWKIWFLNYLAWTRRADGLRGVEIRLRMEDDDSRFLLFAEFPCCLGDTTQRHTATCFHDTRKRPQYYTAHCGHRICRSCAFPTLLVSWNPDAFLRLFLVCAHISSRLEHNLSSREPCAQGLGIFPCSKLLQHARPTDFDLSDELASLENLHWHLNCRNISRQLRNQYVIVSHSRFQLGDMKHEVHCARSW